MEPSRSERIAPTFSIPVEIHRYRVLFSDGELVDYLAVADHSGVRADMLLNHFGKKEERQDRILGVADMGIEYVHNPLVIRRKT